MENAPHHARENRTPKFNSFNRHKAENVLAILTRHIACIPDVKSWAARAGVSRSWLVKAMKETYGLLPKEILREVRHEKVVQIMQEDAEATSYCIAKEAGFPSEDSLRMFLHRHYETNFRELRRQMLNDELPMKWKWLENQ